MEELSRIAMTYYKTSSPDFQKEVRDLFFAMDHDCDGKIDKEEFLNFMRGKGDAQMIDFNQLDVDKSGTLEFREVMTFYYIGISGRPLCGCCNKLITSTFFACGECYDPRGGGSSFDLCFDCFTEQKHDHIHKQFIDNYWLLHGYKSKLRELPTVSTAPPPVHNKTSINNPTPTFEYVPQQQSNIALEILKGAIVAGAYAGIQVAQGQCSIL